MRLKLAAFFLIASTVALAQGRPGGAGQGAGQRAGQGMGQMGKGQGMGQGQMDRTRTRDQVRDQTRDQVRDQTRDQVRDRQRIHQRQLSQVQLNSGAFKMLQNRTGKSADELKQMYANSGARNFGDFASAVVVSKNLNLDTGKVLEGARTQPLGQVLQNMNVERNRAREEVRKAHQEVLNADKNPPKS